MAFVQKAVARLHEPEKLEALIRELGKKHFSYGAKQNYIDVSIWKELNKFLKYNELTSIKKCDKNGTVLK